MIINMNVPTTNTMTAIKIVNPIIQPWEGSMESISNLFSLLKFQKKKKKKKLIPQVLFASR